MMKATFFGVLGVTALLVGCGGGGGGDAFVPPAINETPVAITTSNQDAVALTADGSVSGAVSGGGSILGIVVNNGGPSFSTLDFITNKLLNSVVTGNAVNTALPAGVTVSATTPCTTGNTTFTITTANDPASGIFIAGDTITATANNCFDSVDHTTTSGDFSFSIASGSLDMSCSISCADVAVTISFNNFRVTESGATAVMHGGITLAKAGATDSFSGTSFYVIEPSGAAVHLSNFNISGTTTGATQSTTVNMTVAGTLIDGSITIVTAVGDPLLQTTTELHPHSGTMVVTGSSGSTLTIVAVNSLEVDLTLDPDGPGGTPANATVRKLWTSL